MKIPKKYEIGLTLSGGGARGYAHIGVLRAMEKKSLIPNIISGTSMGSVIGALIANGYTSNQIENMATHKTKGEIFRLGNLKMGISSHEPVKNILEDILPQTFEELKTPLFISTTNLTQAKHEVFHKGNLIDAILASISIPILFNPYEINGNLYVDGGLVKNLPASVIRDNCKLLIGSHVNHMPKNQLLKSTSQIFDRCVRISIYNTIKHDTKLCDVLIDPEKSGLVDITNFTIVSDIINIGYEEAKNKLQRRLMYKSKINK